MRGDKVERSRLQLALAVQQYANERERTRVRSLAIVEVDSGVRFGAHQNGA